MPYLTLWTLRFEETKKFYREILGLPVIQQDQNFIMFDTKGSRLAFHKLTKGQRLERPTAELHFEVDDVDQVYKSLQRKGIKFHNKPSNKPWGNRTANFRDPEGFDVEIIGPPLTPTGEN